MAAAGAARVLTAAATPAAATAPPPPCAIRLVCDRTFCNLEAVAQRLVGHWTGPAIRLLTPGWSTDVAADFQAAHCPKVCANDCVDEIIHDCASLKAGLAVAGELDLGRPTKDLGRMTPDPLEYRMVDLDDVGIGEARTMRGGGALTPPIWPADRHVSRTEAYHFAACVRRVGKLATSAHRRAQGAAADLSSAEEADGVELCYMSSSDTNSSGTQMSPLANTTLQKSEATAFMELWTSLARCDGLCGHPLGHTVKEGLDSTVAWLCCILVFGPQVLAEKAEQRWDRNMSAASGSDDDDHSVFLLEDFDLRPSGYQNEGNELLQSPQPIPVVLSFLKEIMNDQMMNKVDRELHYIVGMLEYIISRLTCEESLTSSLRMRGTRRYDRDDEHHGGAKGVISSGIFLNLHCGHNNQYEAEERKKLIGLIRRFCGESV